LRSIAAEQSVTQHIAFFPSLDYALEAAEEHALGDQHPTSAENLDCFDFLERDEDRTLFRSFCAPMQVPRQAYLCRDGEFSDAIYFVETGSFEVIQSSRGAPGHRLAKISQGAMVGEMAFYTGQARSASIVAVVDSGVYALDTAALRRMRAQCPELATRFDHVVIAKLAHALKRANRLSATLG
jgi:SulP family sulfate permease